MRIFNHIFANRTRLTPTLLSYITRRQIILENSTIDDQERARDFIYNWLGFLKSENVIELKRIGSSNDGGYFLCDLESSPIVLSGGVANDVTFENEFAKRGSLVVAFDPTIKFLPTGASVSIRHYRLGLENSPKIFKNSINLAKAIQLVEESERFNKESCKYLKLDIEGSEWEFLGSDGTREDVLYFDQLIVEFHDFYQLVDPKFLINAKKTFEFLQMEFRVIAVHSNNYGLISNFGEAFIPDFMEVTLLRKDHFEAKKNNAMINMPIANMAANNIDKLDIPASPFLAKSQGC